MEDVDTAGVDNGEGDRFLKGQCSLARKMLPFLRRLRGRLPLGEAPCGPISGIEVYDDYMELYALLAVWMAASINSGHDWWLHDRSLVAELKLLDGSGPTGSMPTADLQSLQRSRQCTRVFFKMAALLVEYPRKHEWGAFFVPVEANSEVEWVERLVDRSDVQMLRDIFFVLTGKPTDGDARSGSSDGVERRVRCEGLMLQADPGMEWKEDVDAESGGPTGLLPVVALNGH